MYDLKALEIACQKAASARIADPTNPAKRAHHEELSELYEAFACGITEILWAAAPA